MVGAEVDSVREEAWCRELETRWPVIQAAELLMSGPVDATTIAALLRAGLQPDRRSDDVGGNRGLRLVEPLQGDSQSGAGIVVGVEPIRPVNRG